MNDIHSIKIIDWCDIDPFGDMYPEDVSCGIYIENQRGGCSVLPFHGKNIIDGGLSKKLCECDMIIANLLARRFFEENNIYCPYNYPLNLTNPCNLFNDARKLCRMKQQGEDLCTFEFEFCLQDVRKDKWVDIAPSILNFGKVNITADDLKQIMYMIEHA